MLIAAVLPCSQNVFFSFMGKVIIDDLSQASSYWF
jgi:hypothetical protein